MKLSDMSFFSLASQRMKWLGARQAVVSENIANADTPEYKAKEISDFQEMLEGSHRTSGLTTTHHRHIQGAPSTGGVFADPDAAAWEQSMDGNTVSLEQQTIKAAEITENYRLAAQLYRKGHDLLTLAVTGIR